VVALTWPSYASKRKYFWDEANAEWASTQARELVDTLAKRYPRLVLVAHSMGNRLALDAVAHMRGTGSLPQVERLIMGSPDVDRATLERLLAAPQGLGLPVTIYASRADQALSASWRAHGHARAGDLSTWVTGQKPAKVFTSAQNSEVVDTTSASHSRSRDMLYHSDFISSPEGAADLCRVIFGVPHGKARVPLADAPAHQWALVRTPAEMPACPPPITR
jgi:esterase/lipase superfamily enzyme